MYVCNYVWLFPTSVQQVAKYMTAWVCGYMRGAYCVDLSTLLAQLLTRLDGVVFDSFLHFHHIATRDGTALEEHKVGEVITTSMCLTV